MLHEWGGLHWLRRTVYRKLLLLLADRILMFSPHVRAELAADPIVGRLGSQGDAGAAAAHLARPAEFPARPRSAGRCGGRAAGRMVIGNPGAIYPGKQPEAALGVVAALKARGENPLFVYLGSFVKGVVAVEEPSARGASSPTTCWSAAISRPTQGAFVSTRSMPRAPEGSTSRRGSVRLGAGGGRSSPRRHPPRTSSITIRNIAR